MKHDTAPKKLIYGYVARLLPPVKSMAGQVRTVVREAAPDKLLEGDGSEMRHLKIRTPAEIRSEQLAAWIRQAIELNRSPV